MQDLGGHSKEKRSDCPLVTLGLVLDGSGFVRRSKMFEGSVSEGSTFECMLKGLEAPPEAFVTTETVREEVQREMSEDGAEVRLYCHSQRREDKENAMTKRFMEGLEKGLARLSENLGRPRGEKDIDRLSERIGRLKEKGHGIGQHYKIELTVNNFL